MAEKIMFDDGVPQVIAMKFAAGKNVTSKFADPRTKKFKEQVQFSAITEQGDEGIFWLDVEPADDLELALRELQIGPGQPFQLTRIPTSRGGCRWDVRRVGDQGGHNVPGRAAPAASSTVAATPERVTRAGAPRSTPAPASTSYNNGNGSAQPPASAPVPAATTQLMGCFMQAIDAIQEAQLYANRKGLGITFSSEDVRATAISCWIQCGKGGGR